MDSERNTILRFVDFLKERGYPESAIIVDYPVGRNYHADVAILGQEKNRPIQIFELKTRRFERSIQAGISTLKKSRSFLGDGYVPAYIIFSEEKAQYLELIDLDNPKEVIVLNGENKKEYSIFDYKSLDNKKILKDKQIEEQKKKKTVDLFRWISWSLGILVFILIGCSIYGCLQIDSNDLILIAYLIGLAWAPFVSTLEISGLGFKRSSKEDEICSKTCVNFSRIHPKNPNSDTDEAHYVKPQSPKQQ